MHELRAYVASIPSGHIDETSSLEDVLSGCWYEFSGSNADKMAGYKLHNRIEQVTWEPPLLSFKIERHGGTARGSSRADIYSWELNVEEQVAKTGKSGYRQVK